MSTRRSAYLELVSGRRRGWQAALARQGLALASLPYTAAVATRNLLYDAGWLPRYRASVPVVVVGNLTVGGTGKTPLVEWVARFYRQREVRVGLLSRGYGAVAGRNDEARQLEWALPDVPHLQGVDRVALAEIAVRELESEVLVLDDGFQYRRLRRDLDLLLIDASNPWGQGWCLPRGLLREPRASLRRAQAILFSRCDQVSAEELGRLRGQVTRLAPGKPIAETMHAPRYLTRADVHADLAALKGRPVGLISGIGHPDAFAATVRQCGAMVLSHQIYPDHHAYTRADVTDLRAWARALPDSAYVLTTQKDWVKLQLDELAERPVWALRVELAFRSGQAAVEELLAAVLPNSGTSRDEDETP